MLEQTHKELSKFGRAVVKQSRTNLTKQGRNDTKNLYNSLRFDLKVHKNSFSFNFLMEEYGAFNDQGVQGAWSKKKAPNSPFRYKRNKPLHGEMFAAWAKRKGINPWAVANSVWKKGVKPSMFFTRPFEQAFKKFPDEMLERFGEDLDTFLKRKLN